MQTKGPLLLSIFQWYSRAEASLYPQKQPMINSCVNRIGTWVVCMGSLWICTGVGKKRGPIRHWNNNNDNHVILVWFWSPSFHLLFDTNLTFVFHWFWGISRPSLQIAEGGNGLDRVGLSTLGKIWLNLSASHLLVGLKMATQI